MEKSHLFSQLEHLHSKYQGTGHADMKKYEWLVNQHRDSIASYVGHHHLIRYFSLVENESIARYKFNLLEKMILPCGSPPNKKNAAGTGEDMEM